MKQIYYVIQTYYNNRNNGAYSTKAKTANLQRYACVKRWYLKRGMCRRVSFQTA